MYTKYIKALELMDDAINAPILAPLPHGWLYEVITLDSSLQVMPHLSKEKVQIMRKIDENMPHPSLEKMEILYAYLLSEFPYSGPTPELRDEFERCIKSREELPEIIRNIPPSFSEEFFPIAILATLTNHYPIPTGGKGIKNSWEFHERYMSLICAS